MQLVIVGKGLAQLRAVDPAAVRGLDQAVLQALKEGAFRVDAEPVAGGGVPDAYLQAESLHSFDTARQLVGEAFGIALELVQRALVHQLHHLVEAVVFRAVEGMHLRPHIVDDRPAYRDALFLKLPAFFQKPFFIHPDLQGIPAAPAQIFEDFRILPLFPGRAAVIERFQRLPAAVP